MTVVDASGNRASDGGSLRRPRVADARVLAFTTGVIAVAAVAPFGAFVTVAVLYGLFLVIGFRSPGVGILTVILMSVLDGAIRKWFAPGASGLVYIAKDILLLAVYAGCAVQGWWEGDGVKYHRRLKFAWIALCIVTFADVAMLHGGDLYVALNGLRMYVLYIPIAWLLPRYLRGFSYDAIRRGIIIGALCVIPMAVLGTFQFLSPKTAVINRYVGDSTDIATFGGEGNVRATGTFSFITGFTDFATFTAALAIGLIIGGTSVLASSAALVAAMWCAVCSGSRLAVVWVAGQSLVTLILSFRLLRFDRALRLAAMLTIGIIAVAALAGRFGAMDALAQRAETAGDTRERIVGFITRPINSIGVTGFFGEGVGTAYQHLLLWQTVRTSALAKYEEISDDRFMLELGYPGIVIELTLRAISLLACWSWSRHSRNKETRILIVALFSYQLFFLWSYPLYDAVASIYYSVSLGIASALTWSERLEIQRTR